MKTHKKLTTNWFRLLVMIVLSVFISVTKGATVYRPAIPTTQQSKVNTIKIKRVVTQLIATISGTTTSYLNSTNPEVTFSATGGTEPYTFTYQINNGQVLTIKTISGNSVSVNAPTNEMGVWTYTLKSVMDKSGAVVLQNGTAIITVNTMPDATIYSSAVSTYVNNQLIFRECYNQSGTLTFTNTSATIAYNTNYSIDWGDNSTPFTATEWNTTSHSYAPGNWTMIYRVNGQMPDEVTVQKIQVYIGSKPAVSMGSPGLTDNCSKMPIFFPISGTEKNPSDTKYTITFNDGSAPIIYNPASGLGGVVHTFGKSSCGTTSYSGTTAYPNSFSASIVAENACGVSAVSVVPIYISTAPVVNFNLPNSVSPINLPNSITNTTTGFVNEGGSCSVIPKLVWKITPSTFTLKGGEKLGADYDLDNSNLWTPGTDRINPTFTTPGIYTIKLRVDTKRCGDDVVEKTICVEAPLEPAFTLSSTTECAPALISTTNSTDVTKSCVTSYKWDVVYISTNCGGQTALWSYSNNTSQSSINPTFKFETPGSYKVKLSTTNSCGTFYKEQTLLVKGPPVVSIEKIVNYCGSGIVHTGAVVNPCTTSPDPLTYSWSFPGGTPSTANTLDPGEINYSTIGTYVASLTVTNDCGTTQVSSNSFNIYPVPQIEAIANQSNCNGEQANEIKFSTIQDVIVEWTNNRPEIGLSASGAGNIAPFKLQNKGNDVLTATITARPRNSITNCTGEAKQFTISIKPAGKVTKPEDQILSNGEMTNEIVFSSTNNGGITTYNWTNSRTDIGINSTGSGTIKAFKAINNTTKPLVDTVTVTPTYSVDGNGCSGLAEKFTITVLPTANVIRPADVEICNGLKTPVIKFNTNNIGGITTYTWRNDNPAIGLEATGSGDIMSFTIQNVGATTLIANIEVTPTFTDGSISNIGTPNSFKFIVNPAPAFISQPVSSYICPGGEVTPLKVSYKDGVGAVSYKWYSNTVNSTSNAKEIVGETKDTYYPPTAIPGTKYYFCVLNSTLGVCTSITSEIATVSINNSAIISSEPIALQNVCVGAVLSTPLSVKYTGGNGTPSYQWYSTEKKQNSGGTPIAEATDSVYTPPVFTEPGHYYYYVVLNLSGDGCGSVISKVAEVNVVSDPVIVQQPTVTQIVCQNIVTSDLSVQASGGLGSYSYQWYQNTVNDNFSGTLIPEATQDVYKPASDSIGIHYFYCVVTQPNGPACSVTSETSMVNVKQVPIISSQPVSKTVCQFENAEPLTIGYSFVESTTKCQWYSNTVNSTSGGSILQGATEYNYQPSTATLGITYYYCVLSGIEGGCADLISNIVSVTVNPTPVIASHKITICTSTSLNFNPASILSNLVPEGTKYTWSTPEIAPQNSVLGATEQVIPGSEISQFLTNLTNNTTTVIYTITPILGSCIAETFNLEVILIPPINIDANIKNSTGFGANNGSIDLVITGGKDLNNGEQHDVSWSGPMGYSSKSLSISGLTPGEYTLTVKDYEECTFSNQFIITEPSDIEIITDIKKNISCREKASGHISISVKGGTPGYTFIWTKDGVLFATTKDIAHLELGIYEITVTDTLGFTSKPKQFNIVEPSLLNVELVSSKNVSCFGGLDGEATVKVSGGIPFDLSIEKNGYRFSWTGPNGFASAIQNISGLLAGTYHLLVTDDNECDVSLSIEIIQPSELILSLTSTGVTCYKSNDASISVTVSGGTAPYTMQWSNFGKGLTQENLQPGNYIVTAIDANGCQKTDSVQIDEANFAIHPLVKNVTCHGGNDGSIDLNITGGISPVTLSWADSPTAGSSRNNLAAGTYVATLLDGAPCQITESFVIMEPAELEISAKIKNAFDCSEPSSGAIELTVKGGSSPFTYLWSNGATTKDISEINHGTYLLTVTDANGCSKQSQFEIIRQEAIHVAISSELAYTCGSTSLKMKVTATASGGFAPYRYKWSVGKTSGTFNEVMEIEHNSIVVLEATDFLGCTVSYSFNASLPANGIEYSVVDCNTFSYQLNVETPQLQTDDYTYKWDFGDGQTSNEKVVIHNFPSTGAYKTKLNINNGSCTYNFEKSVNIYPAIKLALDSKPTLCVGEPITIHALGAHKYRWSNGSEGDSMIIKTAGDYSVIGISEAGCSDTLYFMATNFDTLNYKIYSDKEDITPNGTLHLWSDNIPYSNYFWDFGDGEIDQGMDVYHTFSRSTDGFYDVKLKTINPNGCTEYATKRVWLSVPEASKVFSPNVSGTENLFMKNWEMKLYNRNGILMYNGKEGWDGKYKGEYVAPGTYFYVISYPSNKGVKTKNGYVTVVR